MRAFPFVACLLLLGCEKKSPWSGHSKPAVTPMPAVASTPFKVGDLDKDGRLIFWSIDASDHVEPFVLHKDEYGVVLYNDGTEEKPVARYIFACQGTREVLNTADFAAFQQALAKISRWSTVGSYDTCSVPRSHGLPQNVIRQFAQALTDAGLEVETEDRVVCYCPNGS